MAKGKKTGIKVAISAKNDFKPFMISEASEGVTIPNGRGNRASKISPIGEYANIKQGIFPYNRQGTALGIKTIDIREAVELCQLAWYNVPIFRNAIDTMTDLSNANITLKGGNTISKAFVSKWLEKINIWNLGDQFFREYHRSGNIFLYRFDGDFSKSDKVKFNQVFADEIPWVEDPKDLGELENSTKIPLRYMLLNPTNIRATPNINFSALTYFQAITADELARLQNPKTPEDRAVINNLGPDAIQQIKTGGAPLIPLDSKHLTYVFNNKQDYEPFAIPWGFPVLKDIENKLELKKMDAAVARTTEYAILLITMGESSANGGLGVNPENQKAIRQIFESDSLKKVLIADFTTKGQWLLPDLSKILGPEKYKELDQDIQDGLNMILIGDEKLGNTQAKVAVFTERLKKARKAFAQWLSIEIRTLCKNMGFKSVPKVCFEDINLQNPIEFKKLYTQLYSLGALTEEELIEAIENGKLPNPDESVESQQAFKTWRGKGLYQPVVGGPANSVQNPGGRPTGTKAPKSKKKSSPQGTKQALGFSMAKIVALIKLSESMAAKIESALLKKFKIEKLNPAQVSVAKTLLNNLIANEKPEDWNIKVKSYIKQPQEVIESVASKIDDISIEHDVDFHTAAILNHAEKELEEDA